MGYNCQKSNADMALAAMEDALKNCKKTKAYWESVELPVKAQAI